MNYNTAELCKDCKMPVVKVNRNTPNDEYVKEFAGIAVTLIRNIQNSLDRGGGGLDVNQSMKRLKFVIDKIYARVR